MKPSDQQQLSDALAGIEAVLERSQGGHADDEALLEFRRLCWSALLLVRDAESQKQVDLLVRYAKELYSDCERARAELLRHDIRTSLGTLRDAERRYGKRWRDLRAA